MSKTLPFFLCFVFLLLSCDSGNNNSRPFPAGTPTVNATITLNPETSQLAGRDPYCFSLTVSGVNGPAAFGRFSASFSNLTGSVGVEGLAVVFDEFIQTDTNTYTANGCVTNPFTGQGNVDINVVYDETGITVFGGTFTFTVAVNSFVYCAPLFIPLNHPDYLPPTLTITDAPAIITDVDVLVDISFGFTGNVDLNVLTSPSGTEVILSETFNPRLDLVILDDESPFSVSSLENDSVGGRFAPLGFLSDFDGENANGTWSISFPGYYSSSFISSSYILQRWCLLFNNHDLPPATLRPQSVCDFLNDGDDDDDDDDDDIPEGGSLSRILTVENGSTSITDINFSVSISHPAPEQLTLSLRSPQGTTVILSSGNGAGNSGAYDFVFMDDLSINPISSIDTQQGIARVFSPDNPLSAFTGENANGNWTFIVQDTTADSSSGFLREWCLLIDGGSIISGGGE